MTDHTGLTEKEMQAFSSKASASYSACLEYACTGLEVTKGETYYHYTTQAGLIGILRSVSIRATDVRFLNDRVEFVYGAGVFESCVKAHEISRLVPSWTEEDHFETLRLRPRYTVSFTSQPDSLSQWGMYGDFAIGWDPQAINGMCMSTKTLTMCAPCIYAKEDQQGIAMRFLDKNFELLQDQQIDEKVCLSNIANFWGWCGSFFKHPSFALEKEIRVITFLPGEDFTGTLEQDGIEVRWGIREGGSEPVPFCGIGIPSPKMIVVGPSQTSRSVAAVEGLIKHSGLQDKTVIVRSNLPFRR